MEHEKLVKRSMSTTEILALWVLPFLGWVSSAIYWLLIEKVPSEFFLFIMLIPFLFGYSVVVVGTGLVKTWAWKTRFSIRGTVMPQIGFVWSGYGGIVHTLLGEAIQTPFTVQSLIWSAISFGIVVAATGILVDIFCMEVGLLEVYNRAHYEKLGSIQSVRSYGFIFFGGYGLLMGALAKIGAFYLLEERHLDWFASLTCLGWMVQSTPYLIVMFLSHFRRSRQNSR